MPTNIRGGGKGGDGDFKTQDIPGVREDKGVVIGVVKVNAHPTRSGTIMVFVPTYSDQAREDDKTQWRSVKYATPFYSRTALTNDKGTLENRPGNNFVSVKNTGGFTFPAPDIGTKVLCVFPEGRNSDGFWFACAPDTYMMQSLPESSASTNFEKNPDLVRNAKAPTLEFNDDPNAGADVGKIANFLQPKRALDVHTAGFLKSQGLDEDEIRGLTSSSFTRETPSEIVGVSTKGRRTTAAGQPIEATGINKKLSAGDDLSIQEAAGVEGRAARKKGHALVLDDGDIEGNNNLMRFRTAAGHQVLLHDTENLIYIGNAQGTAWVQLDAKGQVDVYSQTSINLRSSNINMHADGAIKMHAGSTIQLVAGSNLHLEGRSMANLYSDKGPAFMYGGGGIHIKSGKTTNIQAASSMNLKAGGVIAIQGSCVALQSPAAPAGKQNKAKEKSLQDTKPDAKGFWNADKDLPTTVDRAPTHEPYIGHGTTTIETVYESVDIDDVKSGAELVPAKPANPKNLSTNGIERANALINDKKLTPTNIVKDLASGVQLGDLTNKVTKNLAVGVSEIVGSGGAANFISGATNAIGKFGATVSNLQKNGFVRPEAFFNGQLTDPKLWTGKDGIETIEDFLANDFAQENMFYADMFNSMQDAYLNGAISEDDDEATIAGMTMVSYASGDADVAAKYRQGQFIEPRPIDGTTIVPDNNDMTSYYDDYYLKGRASYTQAQSTDGTGYSQSWYTNITGNQVTGGGSTTRTADAASIARDEAELAQDRREQEERRREIAKVKAETGLSGAALLKEFKRRGGSLT